jgi:Tol biopolymer transport system component
MNREWLFRACLVVSVASGAIAAQQAPPAARYYNPRFSADGRRVIFESTRDIKYTVYSIGVDGTGLRAITDSRQNDAQPQWSTDGTMITFTSDTPGVNKVFVMPAHGGSRRQVSTGPRNDAAPSFSTDGTYVAWAATTELAEHWRDIGVAAADGTGAPRFITSGPGNDQAPTWISATRIVFVREFPPRTEWRAMTPEDHTKRRASSEIMAINADGSGPAALTKNEVFDSAPSWAAGLQRIFFTSDRSGASAFYSMRPDGSDVVRIGDVGGSISPDGKLVTYSNVVAGRSGIFVRDLASGVERELVGGEKTMH